MSGRVIGIDFGTTNALCAWLDAGRTVIIPNERGARFTPSVVSYAPGGEVLVGESAKNRAIAAPADTVRAVKRLLGTRTSLQVGGRALRPEDVAAELFAKLRSDAERFLGFPVESAVVTVPASFSDAQRRSLREAAALAGLDALRLVNEPTAAALARAWLDRQKPGADTLVLVYDFGGGTFDVTVLRSRGSACEVLASAGDDRLGGLDIDAALYAEVAAAFSRDYGLDAEGDLFLSQQLWDLVERAKIELSSRESTEIVMPFMGPGGALSHPSFTVTRRRLEELARPFVERTVLLTAEALRTAKVEPAELGALVLSGGSSRMPLVGELLAHLVRRAPESRVNFEEIVASGAAVEAAIVSGDAEGFAVRDVASFSYGVEIEGGACAVLVQRNESLPARKRRVFTTIADGQDTVEIHVIQGEGKKAGDNLSLGRFLLAGVRKARRGEPRILVEFAIDESDLLRVRAKDLDTGAEQRVVVSGSGSDDAAKLALLATRVAELSARTVLESGLADELEEAVAAARKAVSEGDAASRAEARAVLEALAGELFAARDDGVSRRTGLGVAGGAR
ncbi:MAG TPA: Hsp70 family protein [Spirochaetales bacterium]|nr:Hsp70 family protein [Spirochaetales bacterium]